MKRVHVLRWEDPPAKSGGVRNDWGLIGRALRSKPDKWARILTVESAIRAALIAAQIRNGTYAALRPAGAFEATARTVDGEHHVFARYLRDGAS